MLWQSSDQIYEESLPLFFTVNTWRFLLRGEAPSFNLGGGRLHRISFGTATGSIHLIKHIEICFTQKRSGYRLDVSKGLAKYTFTKHISAESGSHVCTCGSKTEAKGREMLDKFISIARIEGEEPVLNDDRLRELMVMIQKEC